MSNRLGSRVCSRRFVAVTAIAGASLLSSPFIAAADVSAADDISLFAQSQSKTSAETAAPSKAKTSEPSKTKKSATETTSTSTSSPTATSKPPRPEPNEYPVGATSEWGEKLQERMDSTTEKATQATGGRISLAVYDRETGELICNDQCEDPIQLASLAKVFIAESVAYSNYTPTKNGKITPGEGDMPVTGNQDAMLRDDAIRYSDNEATSLLWGKYGQGEIFKDITYRYGLSNATQSMGAWGASTSSAIDMVRLFDGIADRSGGLSRPETDYLISLLYSLPRYSYTSADQSFGLRAALPNEEVGNKSGWIDARVRTTTGFVGDNQRFVVAALSEGLSTQQFTDALRELFPDGTIIDGMSSSSALAADANSRGDGTRPAGTGNVAKAHAGDEKSQMWPIWLLVATGVGFTAGWSILAKRKSAH